MSSVVRDVMTARVISVLKHAEFKDIVTLAEAARTMRAKHVKRLPVVTKDRRLVGIVSRTDVLSAYDRPDTDIRDEILIQVIGDQFLLDGRAFSVTVAGGVVTLRGAVDNEAVGGSLLDAVRSVDGVIAVHETLSYPVLERRSHRV